MAKCRSAPATHQHLAGIPIGTHDGLSYANAKAAGLQVGHIAKMETLDLSQDEQALFVELGHHIARVMWQHLGQSDPTFQAQMYDSAMSVYEHGCGLMQELGVFAMSSAGTYRFVMPLDEVRGHLQSSDLKTTYAFEAIIGNFLSAVDAQSDISTKKTPFDVPLYLEQAMWAFVKLDYATRTPEGFKWGDKIKPIMIAEYFWSKDGASLQASQEQAAVARAEAMWNALPKWRRHVLARRVSGKREQDVFMYLFRRWDGKRYALFEREKGKWCFLLDGHEVAASYIVQKLLEIRRSHPF